MLSWREMCVENRWKLEFIFWEQDWSLLIAKEIHHLIPLGPNCYLKMIFRDSSRSNTPWVLTYFNAVVALLSAVLVSVWDLGLNNSWSFASGNCTLVRENGTYNFYPLIEVDCGWPYIGHTNQERSQLRCANMGDQGTIFRGHLLVDLVTETQVLSLGPCYM